MEDTLAKRSDLHLMRRVWHVLCGVLSLLVYYLTDIEIKYFGILSIIIAGLGFILDFQRIKNPKLNEKLTKLVGPILRKSEKYSFSGLPFYALGMSLSIFFYEEKIAILSILFLIFADSSEILISSFGP